VEGFGLKLSLKCTTSASLGCVFYKLSVASTAELASSFVVLKLIILVSKVATFLFLRGKSPLVSRWPISPGPAIHRSWPQSSWPLISASSLFSVLNKAVPACAMSTVLFPSVVRGQHNETTRVMFFHYEKLEMKMKTGG